MLNLHKTGDNLVHCMVHGGHKCSHYSKLKKIDILPDQFDKYGGVI